MSDYKCPYSTPEGRAREELKEKKRAEKEKQLAEEWKLAEIDFPLKTCNTFQVQVGDDIFYDLDRFYMTISGAPDTGYYQEYIHTHDRKPLVDGAMIEILWPNWGPTKASEIVGNFEYEKLKEKETSNCWNSSNLFNIDPKSAVRTTHMVKTVMGTPRSFYDRDADFTFTNVKNTPMININHYGTVVPVNLEALNAPPESNNPWRDRRLTEALSELEQRRKLIFEHTQRIKVRVLMEKESENFPLTRSVPCILDEEQLTFKVGVSPTCIEEGRSQCPTCAKTLMKEQYDDNTPLYIHEGVYYMLCPFCRMARFPLKLGFS